MFDYSKELVANLNTLGIPAYYELFLTKDTQTPCISYLLLNDYGEKYGDTLGYSELTYSIKIWSKKVSEMREYAIKVDDLMRELGFRRISVNELWQGEIGQYQMTFRALAREEF